MRKWVNSTKSRTYIAWRNMKSRCYNPNNHSYAHYGARGITVDSMWLNDFDAFVNDMGHPPEGTSLDRIDNDLGYGPGNCRWATLSEQMNNRSDNVCISLGSEIRTITQWAEKLGVKKDTLWKRLKRMSPREALVVSRKKIWSHGTRHGYEKGCRCDLCKAAHAERFRIRRAKKKRGIDRV